MTPRKHEVVQWMESLVGVLTKIETEYGGISELLEHPDWNEGQTDYFVRLLEGVSIRTAELYRDAKSHVEGRPQ